MWKKPGQSAPFPILLSNSKPWDGQLLDALPNSWESAIPQVRHIESAPKINLFIITTCIGILIIFQYMHYNFFLVKVLKRLKCSDLLGVNYIFTHRSWGVGLWFKVQSNFFISVPLYAGIEIYFPGDIKHGAKKYLHVFCHSIQCFIIGHWKSIQTTSK